MYTQSGFAYTRFAPYVGELILRITCSRLGFARATHVQTHTECKLRPDGLAGQWVSNSEYHNESAYKDF